MWRTIASIVAGLVAWAVVVTLLNFGLRAAIPGYHAAEATLQFTLAMKIGRLTEAALTSLAAGAVVGSIAPSKQWAPWLVGLIILAMFLPVHVQLWNKFPGLVSSDVPRPARAAGGARRHAGARAAAERLRSPPS